MEHLAVSPQLVKLSSVAERVANAVLPDEGLQAVVQAARDIFDAQTAAILVLDDKAESLHVRASRGLTPTYAAGFARVVGSGIVAEVALGGMALLLSDADVDRDAYKDVKLEHDFACAMAVQLAASQRPVGYLYCDHREKDRFGRQELQTLRFLGMLAALALEKQDLEDKVARLAVTDPVTGLYTYNYFYDRLSDDIARVLRYRGMLGVLVFEVAELAKIEESYGRLAAEEVLAYVADIVRSNIRGIDYAARYNANQIIVSLVRGERPALQGVAGRIIALTGETTVTGTHAAPGIEVVPGKRGAQRVTVSVYVAGAVAPEDGRTMAELATSLQDAIALARKRGAGQLVLAGQ
jgi:diguanylate cyclase (GGDEF)-like protein